MTESVQFHQLPPVVRQNILRRLPMEDRFRFRRVSTEWEAIIPFVDAFVDVCALRTVTSSDKQTNIQLLFSALVQTFSRIRSRLKVLKMDFTQSERAYLDIVLDLAIIFCPSIQKIVADAFPILRVGEFGSLRWLGINCFVESADQPNQPAILPATVLDAVSLKIAKLDHLSKFEFTGALVPMLDYLRAPGLVEAHLYRNGPLTYPNLKRSWDMFCASNPHLQCIGLRYVPFESYDALLKLYSLRSLSITHNNFVSSAGLRTITVQFGRSLASVTLFKCTRLADFSFLSYLTVLSKLCVGDCSKFTATQLRCLNPKAPLSHLNISKTPALCDDSLVLLAERKYPLEKLCAIGNNGGRYDYGLEHGRQLTTQGVQKLLKGCPALIHLNVSFCWGIDDSIVSVILEMGSNLRTVWLLFSSCTADGLMLLREARPDLVANVQ